MDFVSSGADCPIFVSVDGEDFCFRGEHDHALPKIRKDGSLSLVTAGAWAVFGSLRHSSIYPSSLASCSRILAKPYRAQDMAHPTILGGAHF